MCLIKTSVRPAVRIVTLNPAVCCKMSYAAQPRKNENRGRDSTKPKENLRRCSLNPDSTPNSWKSVPSAVATT